MSTRPKIESLFKDLLDCHARVKDIRTQIKEELDLYDKGRIESLKNWLESNGKFWCGVCDSTSPLKEHRLFYCQYLKSDEAMHFTIPASSELTPVCDSCYRKFCNRLFEADPTPYRCIRYHLAECRDREYFYCNENKYIEPPNAKPDRYGVVQHVRATVWEKIPTDTKIKLLPVKISIKLAKVLGLLPDIEFKEAGIPVHLGGYEWFLEDHLIFDGKEDTKGR